MRKMIIGICIGILLIASASLLVAGTATLRQGDMSSPAHVAAPGPGENESVSQAGIIDFGQKDSLFFQRPFEPDEGWIFHTSTYDPSYPVDYTCYESFWNLAGPICDIHWWGLILSYPWANCDPQGMEFEIKIYSDPPDDHVNMPPTDVVCTFTNVLPSYTYYATYGGAYDCYYFTFDLVPCCDVRDGWVSIRSTYSPNSCWFLWSGSPDGDAFAYQENGDPITNDLAIVLTGEPGEPWPNHKMHFPQLPDLIGWDVLATYPKILADDWQCSETGYVTDIHFWGSWKDRDGNPYTDDIGQIQYFIFSIHDNIPADVDTPWSRPGELLWEFIEWVPGTPSDPPTMEGWADPNAGFWNCNDHVPYWQYDFVDIPQPFLQVRDQIYWLNISAVLVDTFFQWGWKNSRDHFMDDAVYMDEFPVPTPWFPIYEPPRCNWFDVGFFGPLGTPPEDMGSTNYYGQGWYAYPQYNWWNMWFYDNPFTYDHEKHIWMEFYIEPLYPHSFAEFAINWSTPAWDEMEMGRPPLPEDGNEDLYIGREIFPVVPGPNTIDYWLPYNPEWVSIDFWAQDVIINGWIWHECVETSLDLAFVITGEPLPYICGDANGNGAVEPGDVVYLLNYLFIPGSPPPIPMAAGDVNCDGVVNAADVVYLLNYLFRSGFAPCDPSGDGIPDC
jgi:hypothetical protein